MISIIDALTELNISGYVLRGNPSDETEFNSMFKKVVGSDAEGSAIESSDPNDFGVTWKEVSAKKTELENAEPLRLLREVRNQKLAETDFYALNDVTMTDEMSAYRQALRDITDTYSSLDDVVWPTKP